MAARIAYVTDLDLKQGGGGSYAVNWNAFKQLQKPFDARYVGPIVPRPPRIDVLISKIRRKILGIPGQFAYFSPSTLSSNARRVESYIESNCDGVVFRSAARWSRTKVDVPYFVYLDAVFHTFFQNTFDPKDFVRADIERIFEDEARFLEKADGVFFESKWGMLKAKEAYSLSGAGYMAVGRGGALEPPASDSWDGRSTSIVTMAMNFAQKGGDAVFEAFRQLKPRFPDLTWHIIGGRPPSPVDEVAGVTWEGVLDPGKPDDKRKLESILANAFLLLHPTREDTSPLVITEAAYFGCPSISVNRFAIPELVVNGVDGILIESPDSDSLARAITELMENPERYVHMRHNARQHALANSSWDKVGNLMTERISTALRK